VESWGNGGELGTAVFTVPTGGRKWDVELWVAGVESSTRCRIGAGRFCSVVGVSTACTGMEEMVEKQGPGIRD
jgi:hypothetical protein